MLKDIYDDVEQDVQLGEVPKEYKNRQIKQRIIKLVRRLRRQETYEVEKDDRFDLIKYTDWMDDLGLETSCCVGRLTLTEKSLLEKKFLEGKTIREISAETGVSKSDLGRQVLFIKNKVVNCLKELGFWSR